MPKIENDTTVLVRPEVLQEKGIVLNKKQASLLLGKPKKTPKPRSEKQLAHIQDIIAMNKERFAKIRQAKEEKKRQEEEALKAVAIPVTIKPKNRGRKVAPSAPPAPPAIQEEEEEEEEEEEQEEEPKRIQAVKKVSKKAKELMEEVQQIDEQISLLHNRPTNRYASLVRF